MREVVKSLAARWPPSDTLSGAKGRPWGKGEDPATVSLVSRLSLVYWAAGCQVLAHSPRSTFFLVSCAFALLRELAGFWPG